MKIKEALQASSVTYYPKQAAPNPVCSNCNRLKIDHSNDQMYNCVYALYFKA